VKAKIKVEYRRNAGRLHSFKIIAHLPMEATIRVAHDTQSWLYGLGREIEAAFKDKDFIAKSTNSPTGKVVKESMWYEDGYLFIYGWDIGRSYWHDDRRPMIAGDEVARVYDFFAERGIPVVEYE